MKNCQFNKIIEMCKTFNFPGKCTLCVNNKLLYCRVYNLFMMMKREVHLNLKDS